VDVVCTSSACCLLRKFLILLSSLKAISSSRCFSQILNQNSVIINYFRMRFWLSSYNSLLIKCRQSWQSFHAVVVGSWVTRCLGSIILCGQGSGPWRIPSFQFWPCFCNTCWFYRFSSSSWNCKILISVIVDNRWGWETIMQACLEMAWSMEGIRNNNSCLFQNDLNGNVIRIEH